MSKRKPETITTTIRIDSDLRAKLESIAGRERRSLTGQMILFLSHACENYMTTYDLHYYPEIREVLHADEFRDVPEDLNIFRAEP